MLTINNIVLTSMLTLTLGHAVDDFSSERLLGIEVAGQQLILQMKLVFVRQMKMQNLVYDWVHKMKSGEQHSVLTL